MTFNGQDIVDIAEIYTNISIDANNAPTIINQGLNRLAALGFAFGNETFTIIEGDEEVYQTFTDDVLGVVLVLDDNEKLYNRFQYDNEQGIKFDNAGEYEVIVKIVPDEIADLTTNINLNDIFRTPLNKHFIGYSKLQLNDTSPDGTRLMREFERLGANAYNTLIQANTPSKARIGKNV